MLRAYFDDSGSHSDSRVAVIGGLIGTVGQWEKFEASWADKLANPLPGKPRLRMFHLSHCAALDGEFKCYNRAESDALTHDFRRIIADNGLISTASAVDRIAWDELIQGPIRGVLGSALETCFVNCIDQVIRVAKAHLEGRKVAIIFDQGFESDRLKQIADMYTRSLANPWVTKISFNCVEHTLPLQGADIPATESYWQAQKWLDEGATAEARAHFSDYLSKIQAEGLILGREEIVAEVTRRGPDGRAPKEGSY